MWDRFSQDIKHRGEIQVSHLFPRRIVRLGDRLPSGKAAQHVHQYVRPAMRQGDGVDSVVYGVCFGEVHRERYEIGLGEVLVRDGSRCADDSGAGGEEALRHEGPQPSFCASYENDSIWHLPSRNSVSINLLRIARRAKVSIAGHARRLCTDGFASEW